MSQQKISHPWGSFFVGVVATVTLIGVALGGALADRLFYIRPLDYLAKRSGFESFNSQTVPGTDISQRIINEESAVIEVTENSSPAVVTVSITAEQRPAQPFFLDPFGIFGQPFEERQEPETVERDIGSGFVIDGKNGFVVTNRHVVSNTTATYRIITKDDKEYEVKRIYRDPANDLAIVKVDAELPSLELGDSNNLKVGQFVIAIGTALGEFRHTVTTGVISGLGRGIEAGSGWGSSVERLDNVIQTDAAINPGNSGGPLLNSGGQVVGVNVAVAQGGQNIGFAIPINVVKDTLKNFNETGQFDRPFIGVRYTMITREMALQSRLPEGAYVREVVKGSPAAEAGIEAGDIIITLDGKQVTEKDGGLATIINRLKIGQTIPVEIDREGEVQTVNVTLKTADE
jgi:serine protease Do